MTTTLGTPSFPFFISFLFYFNFLAIDRKKIKNNNWVLFHSPSPPSLSCSRFLVCFIGTWFFLFFFRFPNTNQTKHCWVHYVDFHRCLNHYKVADNPDDPRCAIFKRNYESLCLSSDVSTHFLFFIHSFFFFVCFLCSHLSLFLNPFVRER